MSLVVGCPRCAAPVAQTGPGEPWTCPEHGPVAPLRRPSQASYEAFSEHLLASAGFPTYLPWPMSPGWSVSDFALVGDEPGRTRATLTCCSGTSELDGPVDVVVITEEAGTGLGARCAGTVHDDPGDEAWPTWGGVIPLRMVAGEPEPDPFVDGGAPAPAFRLPGEPR